MKLSQIPPIALLSTVYLCVSPFIIVVLTTLFLTGKINHRNYLGKLGFVPRPKIFSSCHFSGKNKNGEYLWIHVSSIGEWNTAKPFLLELMKHMNGSNQPTKYNWLVTYYNQDLESVIEEFPEIQFEYLPVENPHSFFHLIRRFKIRKVIIVETEIWPIWWNMLRVLEIKVYLINATLFDREARSYGRFGFLFRPLIASLRKIYPVSQNSKNNFVSLGASTRQFSDHPRFREPVNLKFDISSLPDRKIDRRWLEKSKQQRRIIWASIHLADIKVLGRELQLFLNSPDYLNIFLPRNLPEVKPIEQQLRKLGGGKMEIGLMSDKKWEENIIWDGYGDLRSWYPYADLVVMGGTFAPIGGHNILEPIAANKPLIQGQHYFHFREVVDHFREDLYFSEESELAESIEKYFRDDYLRRKDYGSKKLRSYRGVGKELAKEVAGEINIEN